MVYITYKTKKRIHMKRHIDRIEDAVYERGYVYNLHFHIIWCTKYRNPWFTTPELVNEMKDILQSLAKQADVDIQEMEVMPEYIHLLCSFKPKYSITDVVKNLKGASARLFLKAHPEIKKAMFWGDKLWAPSYYVGSVGNISKETVKRYIQNQYDGKGGDHSPAREKESNSSRQ